MAQSAPSFASPGRGAASTTARTSAPPSISSDASCRFSGPLPAINTRRPGSRRAVRHKVCAAPVVITPGSVQPGTGQPRS